eukprot:144773-Chlamydomonas_euryale.AAC.1
MPLVRQPPSATRLPAGENALGGSDGTAWSNPLFGGPVTTSLRATADDAAQLSPAVSLRRNTLFEHEAAPDAFAPSLEPWQAPAGDGHVHPAKLVARLQAQLDESHAASQRHAEEMQQLNSEGERRRGRNGRRQGHGCGPQIINVGVGVRSLPLKQPRYQPCTPSVLALTPVGSCPYAR